MKRPLAVTGFTMLFTLLVLSGSNDKAISAVLLAALIAFVVFMCIKKVRRDKTLPFAALSAAVAVLLLMSNNAYYLGKAKPLNGKEVIISGTLSDLPYEKDGSFYYVVKADTVNGEKSSLSFRVVSKAPLCIDVTDEVSLSAKAFLLGGDSDEILKYYKSKSLFLGAHSPENISIKRGEKKNIGTMLLLLRQKLTSETLRLLPNTYGGLVAGLCYGDKSNIPRNVTTGVLGSRSFAFACRFGASPECVVLAFVYDYAKAACVAPYLFCVINRVYYFLRNTHGNESSRCKSRHNDRSCICCRFVQARG